jgi:hypothetical protein
MAGEQPRNLREQRINPDQSSNTGMSSGEKEKYIEPTGELGSIYQDVLLISEPLREVKYAHELMLGLLRRLAIISESMSQLGPIVSEFIRIHTNMSDYLKESEDIYNRMRDSMSKLVKENDQNDQNDQ